MTEAVTVSNAVSFTVSAGEFRSLTTRSDEEIRTYQRQAGCVNCSTDEWRMLGILSDMYKLDPFAKQIWLIPGVGVMVGHAGFLQIAHRSGRFGGMSTDTYNRDGSIYTGEGLPAYSICTVWYTDSPHPVTKKVIFTDFFKPGQNGKKTNWDKMPGFMIEKVAEVHALKRAFSIGGIYCPEEFGYDEEEVTPKAEFTATVDGEPVKVEPIKQEKPAAKQEPKCTCGAEPMDSYERNKMQAAFDEQGLGTIPENLCKMCATKHWKFLKEQKKPAADPQDPYGMKPAKGPAVPPRERPAEPEPETIEYHGKLIKCVCKKCGTPLPKTKVAGVAHFVGDNVMCKRCDPKGGIAP